MVRNSSWNEDRHKAAQLTSILSSFAKEDAVLQPDSTSFKNRQISKSILEEFSNLFPQNTT